MGAPTQMSMAAPAKQQLVDTEEVSNKAMLYAPGQQTMTLHNGSHKTCGPVSVAEAMEIKHSNTIVLQGACCSIQSLYCAFPQCIGCVCEATCCCNQGKCGCCKCMSCKDEDKRCCIICSANIFVVCPTRCYEAQYQSWCCVAQEAFPCTKDVPCVLTLLPGLVVCANFKPKIMCCPTLDKITGQKGQGGNLVVSGDEKAGSAKTSP